MTRSVWIALGVMLTLAAGGAYVAWSKGLISFGPPDPVSAVSSTGESIADLQGRQTNEEDEKRETAQRKLIEVLGDPDPVARADAVTAAADLLEGVEDILTRAEDEDAAERAGAAKAFEQVGVLGSRGVTKLVELLGDPAPEVSRATTPAAMALGDDFRPVLPALIELLDDEDADVRLAAALAMEAFDEEMAVSIERLSGMLEGAGFFHKTGINRAIKEFGISRTNTRNAFLEHAQDADDRLREVVDRALAKAIEE